MTSTTPATTTTRAGRSIGSRLGLGLAATAGLSLAVAVPATAFAHVTVAPSTTASGAYTVLTFAFGHGCGDSPTTEMAIQIPDGIYAVAPEIVPGWSIEKVEETLDEPVDDGHGGQYTERIAQVVYTADEPVADGYRVAFDLSLKLPEGDAGTEMAFPTVQSCEDGENAWIEPMNDDGTEPPSPAPVFELTAAEGDGHGGDADASAEDASAEAGDDAGSTSDGSSDEASTDSGAGALGWVGAIAGLLGLALGGLALARTRARA